MVYMFKKLFSSCKIVFIFKLNIFIFFVKYFFLPVSQYALEVLNDHRCGLPSVCRKKNDIPSLRLVYYDAMVFIFKNDVAQRSNT